MQERYCQCGQAIMVHFSLRSSGWSINFWNMINHYGHIVRHCPACGRLLRIDDLS